MGLNQTSYQEKMRSWTDMDKGVIQAEFLGFRNNSVYLRLPSGKTIQVHPMYLSQADIEYYRGVLRAQRKERAAIKNRTLAQMRRINKAQNYPAGRIAINYPRYVITPQEVNRQLSRAYGQANSRWGYQQRCNPGRW